MRLATHSYSSACSCAREVLPYKKALEERAREYPNALIDEERTRNNIIFAYHDVMKHKGHQEKLNNLCAYHKEITGKGPRVNGAEKQLSKAIGVIATLPKDYFDKDVSFSDEEWHLIASTDEHKELPKELKDKMLGINWTYEERQKANLFFKALYDSLREEIGVREEDVLYAIVHWDESWPHLHFMGLPSTVKEFKEDKFDNYSRKQGPKKLLYKKGEKRITFTTEKIHESYEDNENFFSKFHQNIIKRMESKGFDAKGLINGATKKRSFNPNDMNHEQREESRYEAKRYELLSKRNKELEQNDKFLRQEIHLLEQNYINSSNRFNHLLEKIDEVLDKVQTTISSLVESSLKEFCKKIFHIENEADRKAQMNETINATNKEVIKSTKVMDEIIKEIKTLKLETQVDVEELPENIEELIDNAVKLSYPEDEVLMELFRQSDIRNLIKERAKNVGVDRIKCRGMFMSPKDREEYIKLNNRITRALAYVLDDIETSDNHKYSSKTIGLIEKYKDSQGFDDLGLGREYR